MTEDNNQPHKNDKPKKTFGYKSKKRRVLSDPEAAMKSAAKASVKEEREAQNKEDANQPVADRQSLVENYTALISDLESAHQKKADLQNLNTAQKTKYTEMTRAADAEISQMKAAQEEQKQKQTRAFMDALKTTEESLQTAIKDIKSVAGHEDILNSFVEGLEMTAQNLSGLFNSFSTDKPATALDEKSLTAPAEVSPESVDKLDLEGKDKDISSDDLAARNTATSQKLDDVYKEIEALEKTQQSLAESLEDAEEKFAANVERNRRDLERQAEVALKPAALEAIKVADQLSFALRALAAQKETLGDSFNSVAAKIEKLEDSLQQSFAAFGIEKIKSLGEKPDYDIHQVIGYETDAQDIPRGHIARVEQDGYRLNRKPLRDALVRIAG